MPKKPSPRRKKTTKPRRKVTQKRVRSRDPAGGGAAGQNGRTESLIPQGAPPPEPLPFDREFFRHQFSHLVAHEPGKARPPSSYVVTVTLGDGMTQLDVCHIEQLEEQWVVFAVYDGANYRDHSGATRYVFVPYGTIARIEVTGIERRIGAIGFHRATRDSSNGKAAAGEDPTATNPTKKRTTKKRTTKTRTTKTRTSRKRTANKVPKRSDERRAAAKGSSLQPERG